MKATINGDGTLILFPTTQCELYALKQLVCSLKPPVIVIDSQPYMGEPDYVAKVQKQTKQEVEG